MRTYPIIKEFIMPNAFSLLKNFATENRGTIGLLVGLNLGSFLTLKSVRAQQEWYKFLEEEGVIAAFKDATETE
jgi:hypothetical protein